VAGGFPELVARRPAIIIVLWLVIAAVMGVLGMGLDRLVVVGERSLVPSNVESALADKALRDMGLLAEPDAVLVVDGVEVSLDTYWGVRDMWKGIDWGSANHTSWIDVLERIRENASSELLSALNRSLEGLRGLERLWRTALNVSERLHGVAQLVNATAVAVSSASRTYLALLNASKTASQNVTVLLGASRSLAKLCELADVYAATLTRVVLVERWLEAEGAYGSKGFNATDPLTAAVYAYVARLGGPGAFNNTVAASLAAHLLRHSANLSGLAARYVDALADAVSRRLTDAPDLRSLSPEELNMTVSSAVAWARTAALLAVAPLKAKPIAEALASVNCDAEEAATSLIAKSIAARGVPSRLARIVALFAVGRISEEELARASVSAVAEGLAARGAPPVLTFIVNSSDVAKLVTIKAPVLAGNASAARLESARLVSEKLDVPRDVAEALAMGEDPVKLAVKLVAEKAPEEARPFLDRLAERMPGNEDEFLAMAVDALAEAGGGGLARDVAEAAARIFANRSTLGSELDKLVRRVLGDAWSGLLAQLRGRLVSRSGDAFTVSLFNASYSDIRRIVSEIRRVFPGADVYAVGRRVVEVEAREAALEDVRRSDALSMAFVLALLAVVLEGLVAVFIPFVGIGAGLATAMGIAYLLASSGALTVTNVARTLMFSTGLGLGIDYAALVSRRFREELAAGRDPRTAAARVLRRSARPVLAGAATASIGFASMTLAWDFPFLVSIGKTVPIAIAVVVAASLTLVPALLALLGGSRIVWWPSEAGKLILRSERLGRAVAKAAPILLIAVSVTAAVAIMGVAGFSGSHDVKLLLPADSQVVKGMDIVSARFDPGLIYPLYIVSNSDAVDKVLDAVKDLGCVSNATKLNDRVVMVVMGVDPLSREGLRCAEEVREAAHGADPGSLVGGAAATSLDMEAAMNSALMGRAMPVALAAMVASMFIAYGSLVMALAAVAGVVTASYVAMAIAIAAAGAMGIDVPWFLPTITLMAVLGVGMDYASFAISRLAEECVNECSRDAVARGVAKSALFVIALSAIMASAYAGLIPSTIPMLKMLGIALSTSVMLAGIFAGVALLPSVTVLLNRWAWWPLGPKAET